jgi:lipoprotein NlpI
VIAPNGTLVMYSAALSSVISDNGNDHSLFVQELLKEIRVPDLMAEETLNRTRLGVTRASRAEQVPWISSSLAEDFSFIPGANPRPSTPAIATLPQPPQSPPPPPLPSQAPVTPPKIDVVAPVEKPVEKNEGSPAVALADDPTIKALTAKLADNPDDQNALYRRGQVYASKGAYELAVKDFDGSIRLNPKDVEALNNRCWVRTVIGDLPAALKDCNEALRLRPNFVDALDSRGLVNLKSGQIKNAIIDFDAALKINPRLTSSLYGRGLAKKRNGAGSEGDLDIANAKAMDPNIAKEYADYGVN